MSSLSLSIVWIATSRHYTEAMAYEAVLKAWAQTPECSRAQALVVGGLWNEVLISLERMPSLGLRPSAEGAVALQRLGLSMTTRLIQMSCMDLRFSRRGIG